MDIKGSITVFFTLLLSLVISLISTLLLSAKIAAGRTQIALAVDQAMFSAMAKYDRQLFEEYHLLYMDGGYGTGTLQLGKALDEIESDISYVLTPNKERKGMGGDNLLQLEKTEGAITGYTLATDCNGSVFKEQVVSYMEDTLGIQGVSLLLEELTSQKETLDAQESARKEIEDKGTLEDYEDIKTEAMEREKIKAEKENAANENQGTEDLESTEELNPEPISEETKKIAKQAEVTLDTVSVKKDSAILNLVLAQPQSVSGWAADEKVLLSERDLQTGMGYLQVSQEASVFADVFLQEYFLQNLNHYQNEKHAKGPAYGVEWILFGKISDMENLEAMASRLLLVREAANVTSLCMDRTKMSEISILADSLALVFEMPFIKPILEGAIVLAWAYAESLVDVSALFDGSEVPLVKDSNMWQVSFDEVAGALQSPGNYYQESSGMSYEDYLRVFLTFKSEEDKLRGGMEVIEQSMRGVPGKEQFSLDCAIDTLETEFQVRSQDYITFHITRQRSYRNL